MRTLSRATLVGLLLLLVPAGAGLAEAQSAGPTWRRIVTPNFVVVGEVGERQLQDVARRLEEFSEVVRRVLPQARITPPAPTTVVVFATRKSLQPFAPRFDGTTREDIGGYFQAGRDRNYIGLLHGSGGAGYRVVFHELAHLIVNNTTPDVPVWFNEGLAEFYSTFELSSNGRQGTIGQVVPEHVRLLRRRFMPLERLLTATRQSPEYNERERASIFYAQSWALVHYLLIGQPERAPQLFAFLDRLRQGTPLASAFREGFGIEVAALERELRDYVKRQLFSHRLFQLDEMLVAERYQIETISDAAADAVLGDLLVRLGRPEEGRPRLERALALDPQLSDAHAALGVLEWRDGRPEESLSHLARAVETGPDNGHAHVAYGWVLVGDGATLADPASRGTAVRVLTRATEMGPEWPDPWFLLAQAQVVSGQVDEARQSIDRAMALAPGRLEYRLVLAQVAFAAGDSTAARAVLGPLLAEQDRPEVAAEARRLLAQIAARPRAETRGARDAAPEAPPSAGGAERERGGLVPIYRTLQAGEERARGRWLRLECRGQVLVLHVQTGDEVRLFGAPADAIELISHRDDRRGTVTCGVREAPEDVLATWRPGETVGHDRLPRLVALEILPIPD